MGLCLFLAYLVNELGLTNAQNVLCVKVRPNYSASDIPITLLAGL